jgi:hypothetical protein
MKINKILFGLTMLIISCLYSCKDSNNDGIPDLLADKMSASINGVQWTSITRVAQNFSTYVVIVGTDLSGKTITITVNATAEGTYQLSLTPPATQCGAVYKTTPTASTTDAYISSSGNVVLTKFDKTNKLISGTFDFVLRHDLSGNTVTIANGKFTDLKF